MDDLLQLEDIRPLDESYLIVGWRQWADAGEISSALPQYLVDQTQAQKVGMVKSDPFYLFQIPGTQHFLRPDIKMVDGHRAELRRKRNELFYSGDEHKGLYIFLGDEPHLNIDRYVEAFFNLAQELKVKRIAAVGGVYAPVPYDKERQISCSFSLPRMKKELDEYAVQFSNYEGGVSIGTYLTDRAEQLGIEYLVMYAMVPMYDFSQLVPNVEGITIEQDYKAWYDLMRRFNYMFKLGIDLADLEQRSRELIHSVAQQIETLEKQAPQEVRKFLEKVNTSFTEPSFVPLDDVWKMGLKDLFSDSDE